MERQCAWCLRLIGEMGERVSLAPLPKSYEASHGICEVCGALWMEQVLISQGIPPAETSLKRKSNTVTPEGALEGHPGMTLQDMKQLIVQLQHRDIEMLQTKRLIAARTPASAH